MLDYTKTRQLEEDFERYMLKFYAKYKRFSLEDFGDFSATILNYNVQNNVIDAQEKGAYAAFLVSLYNKGIGNRITEEHQRQIANAIASDYSVNFTVIKELFG